MLKDCVPQPPISFSCQCNCVSSSLGRLFKSNGRHHLNSICYRCRQSDFTSLTKTSKSPLIDDYCANLPTVSVHFCKSDNLSQKSIYFLVQRRIFVFLIFFRVLYFCFSIVLYLFRWFTGALYLSLAIILALAIFEEPEVIQELVISQNSSKYFSQDNWWSKLCCPPQCSKYLSQDNCWTRLCFSKYFSRLCFSKYFSRNNAPSLVSGCSNKEFISPTLLCHCKFVSRYFFGTVNSSFLPYNSYWVAGAQ